MKRFLTFFNIEKFDIKSDCFRKKRTNNVGDSLFDYNFLLSLNERDYKKYLCKAYLFKTGKKLNIKHPKTLSEKIQWLKLYDNLPIKSQLTDKLLVRNFIEKEIGGKYLKPVIQICDNYDEINFEKVPECFLIKCNHGCKWHFIVKNKTAFLKNDFLINYTKNIITGWLNQSFFGWSDFELQYKNILPKIFIEPLLRDDINESAIEFEIFCFNSVPKIFQKIKKGKPVLVSIYDESYKLIDLKLTQNTEIIEQEVDTNLKLAVELSKKLSKDFKFVRIDWLICKNKLYFNEMTFTPYSGYIPFPEAYKNWDIKLGKMLSLKGETNEK